MNFGQISREKKKCREHRKQGPKKIASNFALYLDAVPIAVSQAWSMPLRNLNGFLRVVKK